MIKLNNVNFGYNETTNILNNFSKNFDEGKIYALVGRSGMGKTTILRLICGLEKAQEGNIQINGEIVDNSNDIFISPFKRKVGLVFQDYALFPHLNVRKNIEYGCENKEIIDKIMKEFNIEGLDKKKVYELSGGQQQRVALARTIANEPNILLLDEPFSNVDDDTKENIKNLIKEIVEKRNLTTIIVSHNKTDYEDFVDEIVRL